MTALGRQLGSEGRFDELVKVPCSCSQRAPIDYRWRGVVLAALRHVMYRLASELSATVGLEFGFNDYETRQLHDEIFVQGCYDDGSDYCPATVLDVGANIGVFAAWARRRWPDARIVCVEPIPELADVLRRNFESDPLVDVIEAAVGPEDRLVEMAYFPNCTILSGIGVDDGEAAHKIYDYVLDWVDQQSGAINDQAAKRIASAMARGRSTSEPRVVRCVTLASIIDRAGAADFLKIDIEGAELDALRSLTPTAWGRVQKVAVEPELHAEDFRAIRSLLEVNGFHISGDEDRKTDAAADAPMRFVAGRLPGSGRRASALDM